MKNSSEPYGSAVICTVVTRNYISHARALCHSFKQFHPDGKCYVLIVDDYQIWVQPEKEPFEVIPLDALSIPDSKAFCFQYTAFELCNALKPYLLNYLIHFRNENSLFYLDSDVRVMGPLDPLFHLLEQHDILLTPHMTRDSEEDGLIPGGASENLKSGVFNAGVVGVSSRQQGRSFVEWWSKMLRHNCVNFPIEGFFVDQKFLDLVPCLFDSLCILKHQGVNVAFFNLHLRKLKKHQEEWLAGEERLLLFHFTQVDPVTRSFTAWVTRDLIKQQPILQELLNQYSDELAEHNAEDCNTWGYGYSQFSNGLQISIETRREFRLRFISGNFDEDPFSAPEWVQWEKRLRMLSRVRFVRAMLRQPSLLVEYVQQKTQTTKMVS